MYCKSCRNRVSPRDRTCPSCGKAVTKSGDLGSASVMDNESSGSATLPPVPTKASDKSSKRADDTEAKSMKKTPKKEAVTRLTRRAPDRKPEPKPARKVAPKAPEPTALALHAEDVRSILAGNPELLEPGLRIYRGAGDETMGSGMETEVGEIDLLARDSSGSWVVVTIAEPDQGKELIGELLERMGWVRTHLGEDGQEVRGMLLLSELPESLGYAASAVADTVEFKLYRVALSFESVAV